MKLRVQRRDGRIESIEILGEAVQHGETLNHIHSSTGMSHWFTPEGYYDGWEVAVGAGPEGVPEDALELRTGEAIPSPVRELIERIEAERQIEGEADDAT